MSFFDRFRRSPSATPPTSARDTYAVVIHEEEGAYWAEVPELPGCASQGKTMDELLENIVDAIQGCLAVEFEDKGRLERGNVITMNIPVPYPGDDALT